MTRVLVAYSSTHGHTAQMAHRIRAGLVAEGVDAETGEIGSERAPGLTDVDAVLIAGSVHRGEHQPVLMAWIAAHRDALARVPTALVSVSLSAADPAGDGGAAARGYVGGLISDAGWRPDEIHLVAGALQYREYDPLTRLLMRLIAHHHGLPATAHEDIDLTDWDAVDDLARSFATRVAPRVAPGVA